jgi:DNA-binding GntR family transcriptional regulator
MERNGLSYIERGDPLVEIVLEQITDAIVTGRLTPGERLVEARLGDQLGVSRGPVREALRRLEQMGLVEKTPYQGTFVSDLSDQDVEELHGVRVPLEGLAARLAAKRSEPKLLDTLKTILDEMREAGTAGDPGRMVELDMAFHNALIELSGHRLLGELWLTVSIRLHRFLLLKRKRLYDTLGEAAPLHEPIVHAIASGDADQAEAEVLHHLSEAAKYLDYFEMVRSESPQAEVIP